jgi:hypothetical protein
MFAERQRLIDAAGLVACFRRPLADALGITGCAVAELRGPDGELKLRQATKNMITDVGDTYLAALAFGGSLWTYRTKTGSGSTAAAKSGAGSFIGSGDYNAGSAHAMASTYPKLDAAVKKILATGTSGTLAIGDIVLSVTTEGGSTPDAGAGQGVIVQVTSATTLYVSVASGTFATGAGHYLVGPTPGTNHLDGVMSAVTAMTNNVRFQALYAAGENTNTIRRWSIVDNATDAAEADATHTLMTSVFGADIPKAAGDTLTLWDVIVNTGT